MSRHETPSEPYGEFFHRTNGTNEYISPFTGLDISNKFNEDNINNIILNYVPNGGLNQSYIQGFEFNSEPFNMATKISEWMETPEQVLKGVFFRKKTHSDSNNTGQRSNTKDGVYTPTTKYTKGSNGKPKINILDHHIVK